MMNKVEKVEKPTQDAPKAEARIEVMLSAFSRVVNAISKLTPEERRRVLEAASVMGARGKAMGMEL